MRNKGPQVESSAKLPPVLMLLRLQSSFSNRFLFLEGDIIRKSRLFFKNREKVTLIGVASGER